MKQPATGVMSVREAAESVGIKLIADGEFETLGFLTDNLPQMLTFVEDRRFLTRFASHASACAVMATAELVSTLRPRGGVLLSANPRKDFARLHNFLTGHTEFYRSPAASRIDASARIHPRAQVAENNVLIGPEVVIEANAVIDAGCTLERGVLVRSGAILGAVGFQTVRDHDEYIEMMHAGSVVVEEGAHILSHATIARGLFRQSTRIGRSARIGNNAFISHNVEIGALAFVGHGAVLNGNTCIGRRAWIGPGAVLANSVRVGDNAQVSLGAVVIRDVGASEQVSGNFAVAHQKLLRHTAGLG
jgi:UDP-3-O-[3-hydroxymyristoyl] glucosamine N-acyltransferase